MANNTIDLKYLVNYDQLKAANAEILKTGSNAQKSASVFEQAFRKTEVQNKKALSSVRQKIAFSQRMEAQKAKEARVVQQAADKEVAALERLRQKYDQGHVAMEIYSKELNDLAMARKAGIISAKQQTEAIERLNIATKQGTVVSAEFGGTAGQMGRRMSRSGVMVQQAGYQVGDFIVQAQSGQNIMVAFGQQATQMAGTLTMLGGKFVGIGTVLGIAIPLATAFGAAMMRTRKNIDKTSDSAKTLEGRIKGINEEVEKYFRNQKALKEGVTPEVFDLSENIEAKRKEVEELKAFIEDIKGPLLKDGMSEEEIYDIGGIKEHYGKLFQATRELNALRLKEALEVEKKKSQIRKEGVLQSYETEAESEKKRRDEELAEAVRIYKEKKAIHEAYVLSKYETEAKWEKKRRDEELKEAVKIYKELKKARERGNQEETSLNREISLLTMIEKFGEDSLAVQRLKKQQAIAIYEEELKRLNLSPSIIEGLLKQKSLAIDLSNAVSNAASEADRLASNLETSMSYGSLADGEFSGVPSGLDAFGGAGDYRYDLPSKTRPPKDKSKGGGGKGKKDPLAELRKRIELDTKLLDKTVERQEVERAISESRDKYSEDAINQAVAELELYNKIVYKRRQIDDLFGVAQSTMEDGFMAMVEGTKSVEDAFKDMARQIIAELYRVLVVQQMVGSFSADGGGILGGAYKMFGGKASGGTVMSNTPYLVGEKGPELIVPQNRGHVMNADLTSKAMGGSGGTVVVNQNFNFQANGDESVKKIIAQAAPSIANMAKQSVIDARRRGGVMKNTFG